MISRFDTMNRFMSIYLRGTNYVYLHSEMYNDGYDSVVCIFNLKDQKQYKLPMHTILNYMSGKTKGSLMDVIEYEMEKIKVSKFNIDVLEVLK